MRKIFLITVTLVGCLAAMMACTPSRETRYEDWKTRCLAYGYLEDNPQLERCIQLQEREYQHVIIPWY